MANPELKLALPRQYQESVFEHSDTNRARLVLQLTCSDKYGLMFAAGSLMALRDLDLLVHTRVISGSGLGQYLVALLSYAARRVAQGETSASEVPPSERAWRRLLAVPGASDIDYLLQHVFVPCLAFCSFNQELELLRRRLCGWKWLRFFSPWAQELSEWLDELSAQMHTTDDVSWHQVLQWCAPSTYAQEHPVTCRTPVLLFNAARRDSTRPVCLSSGRRIPEIHGLLVECGLSSDCDNLASFMAPSLLDLARFGSCPQQWRGAQARISSIMDLDPFATEATNVYYTAERCTPLPGGRTLREAGPGGELRAGEKLLLVDAFSHSPYWTEHSDAVLQNRCATYIQDICGTGDAKGEKLMAYQQRVVQLYEPLPVLVGDEPDEFAQSVHRFQQHLASHAMGLSAGDPTDLRHAANLGYVRTFYAWCEPGDIERMPVRHLCPAIGDDHMFFYGVYGKARWDSIQRQRRQRYQGSTRRFSQFGSSDGPQTRAGATGHREQRRRRRTRRERSAGPGRHRGRAYAGSESGGESSNSVSRFFSRVRELMPQHTFVDLPSSPESSDSEYGTAPVESDTGTPVPQLELTDLGLRRDHHLRGSTSQPESTSVARAVSTDGEDHLP